MDFQKGSVEVSSKGIVAIPLTQAMTSYGNFLLPKWAKETLEEKDPFYLHHLKHYEQGYFIFVPPKCKLETPIVITLTDSFAKIEIVLGKEAEATIVLNEKSTASTWMNNTLSFSLDMGARCSLKRVIQEDPNAFHFSYVRASLKKDAYLQTVTTSQGSKGSRQDYKIALLGENGEAELNGIWKLRDTRHNSTNIQISHLAPHTRSMQRFKGVQEDFSQASFQGQIFVAKVAQKTQAYQLNKNILLGERAICNSKPNLQIFADDVKASHGATIGQLDERQLFYLTSRGIPLKRATELLLEGFCNEIYDLL